MNIILPSEVKTALTLIKNSGFEGYIVGGCVRDCLLRAVPNDFDITTNATPLQIKEVFKDYKTIDTGICHGTVTVLIKKMPLEITTYRIDGDYFDKRHPSSVVFSKSLKDDLSRRDFTINALCYDEEYGVIDEFSGVSDLNDKIIRTVGNPDLRFSEDALRIIRAIRFASVLGFSIEKETSESILKNKDFLKDIAVERIAVEFTKLLMGKNVFEVLMKYHEVIEVFIPELSNLYGCKQQTKYHKYDVFEHSMRAVANIESDKNLRLAMFFHDFGKPQTKLSDFDGTSHFKGHAKISEKICIAVLKRLKFDKKTIFEVSTLVRIHGQNAPKNKIEAKKLLSEIGISNYKALIKIKRADVSAKAEPHSIDGKLSLMEEFLAEIQMNKECYLLKDLAINGDDVLNIGINSGEEIREKLLFALNAVIEGKCKNEKSELLKIL
ncbi:MAG: CCA tRNA nucleotidyltransferase [Oscillospiraceae bacterium]